MRRAWTARGKVPYTLNDSPRISVIATVRNDLAGTRSMLEALVGQTRAPDEIVIVDAGSTDGTQEFLASFDAEGVAFRWIEDNGLNIAAGRNRAIAAARHDVIACTDAGCVPDATWLEELTAPFTDADVMVVGGGYRVSARAALERVVGLLTMPGELKPLDPLRFNPSARSLAFRRAAWERAGRFPDWLYTAEDTLFACKLRRNRERYLLAEHAVVRWQPRTNWLAVWRQFRNYARGEAHIGRGADATRFWKRRYAVAGAGLLASIVGAALGLKCLPTLGLLAAAGGLVGPVHRRARAVARRTHRSGDYVHALALSHWIALASLRGHRMGTRDIQGAPHTYLTRLREYWGAAPVSDCPPWNILHPPIPRTLVVTWHWPPTRRASTQVLANLFAAADAGAFRILTRGLETNERDPLEPPAITAQRLPWTRPNDRDGTLGNWFASIAMTVWMVTTARRLHQDTPFQRILGVYPHRYSLLAAWLTSRWLGVPLVAYMHDLCAETLITQNRLKRGFWTFVDRHALRSAFLVAVPTREFALHYRSRGVLETWVLPHCNPEGVMARIPEPPRPTPTLRVLYAGNLYQAHEDAVRALLHAADALDNVELEFLCPPNRVVPAERTRWVDRAEAQESIRAADVVVVALSGNTPYPREVMGCFPSKIVDFLAAGRPILAIAPAHSFVDRFVRTTGCGVSVTSQSPGDIARVLLQLADASARQEMSAAALRVSAELEAEKWMHHFSIRLGLGAPVDPSSPPFPDENAATRSEPPVAATADRSA